MKIAFVFGSFCISRPFDFTNLYDDPRGLTGSEVSCFEYARGMAELGHQVTIFTVTVNTPNGYSWNGVTIRPFDGYDAADKNQFDVIMAWMNADFLFGINSGPLRVMDQQLNDFGYCRPGWENFIDVIGGLSEPHTEYLKTCAPSVPEEKWESFYNGVNPNSFGDHKKVPGRVIYASSPDRGLHLLLQQWPEIKRSVPHASLRIFYNFDSWVSAMKAIPHHAEPALHEQKHRALYCVEALKRLQDYGVEHYKSVSRSRISREMAEAEILAYPCDPVRWTEGFSNVTLEACSAGVVPIISNVDALEGIYGKHAVMVYDIKNNLHKFTSTVIQALKDPEYRESVVKKTKECSKKYEWRILAKRLEGILNRRLSMRS